MGIRGFDHLAITVADVARSAAFYRDVLGAELLYLDRFEAGRFPIVTAVLGANRINIHPSPPRADLVAEAPTPGSVDLCFRWDGPIADALALVERHGLALVEGPAFRLAADGSKGQSVYTRDPDGNLIEFLTTDG
ncbi:MAG: VOC family protein [Acidimicrobiales bacterium]|nr:VOC family protein [Acidimicrobiales bacterium]